MFINDTTIILIWIARNMLPVYYVFSLMNFWGLLLFFKLLPFLERQVLRIQQKSFTLCLVTQEEKQFRIWGGFYLL